MYSKMSTKVTLSEPLNDNVVDPNKPTLNQRSNKLRFLAAGVLGFAALFAFASLAVLSSSSTESSHVDVRRKLVRAETLPDPSVIYNTPGCPFSSWFNNLPSKFGLWETNMVSKYETTWTHNCSDPSLADSNPSRGGCPVGFGVNDHNYNTLLGQGNTLGFLAGHIAISGDIPEELRFGMFANPGAIFPMITRFSDFGDDNSALRLNRLAFKIPFDGVQSTNAKLCPNSDLKSGSWYNEINLLFTETLDAFPLADYDSLASFASDPAATTWDTLMLGADFAKIIARSAARLALDNSKGPLGRQYYSQLPYALGCNQAAKFFLEPNQQQCGWFNRNKCCMPNLKGKSKFDVARSVRNHIVKCGASFNIKIQVKNIEKEYDTIMKNAAAAWSENYIEVGKLVLPAQEISDDDVAMSKVLQQGLTDSLPVSPGESEGIHKLLTFHPLLTANDHEPLGEINSYRAHFYSQHALSRYRTLLHDVTEKSSKPKPPYKTPFGQFVGSSAADLDRLFGQSE